MADRMTDASQTREAFNAAIKEVCKTYGIGKFHDKPEQCINTWQITGAKLHEATIDNSGNHLDL